MSSRRDLDFARLEQLLQEERRNRQEADERAGQERRRAEEADERAEQERRRAEDEQQNRCFETSGEQVWTVVGKYPAVEIMSQKQDHISTFIVYSFTPQNSSGWTPLHQAVFMGASHQQISRLIQQFGALRLLRTSWTDSSELPYRRMTAAEIARELGYTDLFTLLAPTIYHCVPYDVLATLQEHFHGLIRLQLHQLPQELANLRLPELVVLTELRVPLMWFPLKPAVTGSPRGYMYRLDRRELLVKSFRIGDPGNIKLFRISEAGLMEIEEAIVFNI
ncbi:hypothetical protein B0J14DRAFT_704554 [Halenospora varia]|nr:hypothetical protein B0J14DRAFT_704554 [Halenospora varia]